MRILPWAAILLGLAATGATAAPQTRVCSKYSTILLNEGESAEVNGAGEFSLFLLIKGPAGSWIFFDSIKAPSSSDIEGTLVLSAPDKAAYRRSFHSQIYAIQPAKSKLVGGKAVRAGVMGVDVMREQLNNPAIKRDDTDLAVIKRVLPGVIGKCDLRFVAGQGLVRARKN